MTSKTHNKPSTRTYGGLSETERVVERRERFLDAGLELFGSVGLRGATVRALCRTAGLTERYFYESFEDTEALFCAVYQKQLVSIQQYFAAELPKLPTDIDARVKAALDLYFTLMRNDRALRVLYLESMVGSQKVIDMHYNNVRLYGDVAAQWIRIDNPDLTMSDDAIRGVALAINGACNTLAVEWMVSGYRVSQAQMVESCALVVLGIMRELRARNAGTSPRMSARPVLRT